MSTNYTVATLIPHKNKLVLDEICWSSNNLPLFQKLSIGALWDRCTSPKFGLVKMYKTRVTLFWYIDPLFFPTCPLAFRSVNFPGCRSNDGVKFRLDRVCAGYSFEMLPGKCRGRIAKDYCIGNSYNTTRFEWSIKERIVVRASVGCP